MIEGGYPIRLQGCNHNSPKHTKGKCSNLLIIEASLHVIVYCRENTEKIRLNRLHLDQAEILPESQWIQEGQKNKRYDLFS